MLNTPEIDNGYNVVVNVHKLRHWWTRCWTIYNV